MSLSVNTRPVIPAVVSGNPENTRSVIPAGVSGNPENTRPVIPAVVSGNPENTRPVIPAVVSGNPENTTASTRFPITTSGMTSLVHSGMTNLNHSGMTSLDHSGMTDLPTAFKKFRPDRPVMASMFNFAMVDGADDLGDSNGWAVAAVAIILGGAIVILNRDRISQMLFKKDRQTAPMKPEVEPEVENLLEYGRGRWFSGEGLDREEPLPELRDGEGKLTGYRLNATLPEGAINPFILMNPQSVIPAAVSGNPVDPVADSGSPITTSGMTGQRDLKVFPTLTEMDAALTAQFGEAEIDPLEGNASWRVSEGSHVIRYETAFGDTVVFVEPLQFFDKDNAPAGDHGRFIDHETGKGLLPAGDYSTYPVSYHFDAEGDLQGIVVRRTVIEYQERRADSNGYNIVRAEDVAAFGEPGRTTPAASRENFVAMIRADHPEIATEKIRGAVIAALKDWFSMDPDVRGDISARGLFSSKLMNFNRIKPEWIAMRAMDHLEGRGGSLFSVMRVNDGLEVVNATVSFDRQFDSYSIDRAFSFGLARGDAGFEPPEALVSYIAIALQKRPAFGGLPRNAIKEAVRKALVEERYQYEVVDPKDKEENHKGAIPIVLNGRKMELQTRGIESSVRDILFGIERTKAQEAADKKRTPIRLGEHEATTFVPRDWLPKMLLTEDGNLKPFASLNDIVELIEAQRGEPQRVVTDPERGGGAWTRLAKFTDYGMIYLYELKDGVEPAEVVAGLGHNESGIDFPTGDIKYVVRFIGDTHDRNGERLDSGVRRRAYPNTAHNVYYFFGRDGSLTSAMVVNVDQNDPKASRVALRVDTQAIRGGISPDEIRARAEEAERVRKATSPTALERAGENPRVYVTLLEMKAEELLKENSILDADFSGDPIKKGAELARKAQRSLARARPLYEEIVAVCDAMIEKLRKEPLRRLDAKTLDWFEVRRYLALDGLQITLTSEGKMNEVDAVWQRMGQLKPWVERLPLYVETVKKPMDAMVQGMAAEGVQFAKDIAGAPKVFTSADAARDIRGILSLAWEDIKVGRFHLAGHKIESIGILIREITDSPARATMGLLDVAVNEALADLTRLTGWLDMARAYYSRTLAAALMNGTGNGGELIGRGFEVGLLKDVDGKVLASKETGQLIEDFWREVLPEDGLFRDALTALDGGTITAEELKRPAVDVSAPELGSAARAEARTEKLLRTRREMLEAARKLRESTKKARDR